VSAPLASIRKAIDDGAYAQAEAMARTLIAEQQKAGRSESSDVADAMTLLVEALWRGGKTADPETHHLGEESIALSRKVSGEHSAQFASSLSGLANVLMRSDDFAGSRDLFRKALALREEIFGPESPEVAVTLTSLAAAEGQMGNFPVTKALIERAYTICEQRNLWDSRTVVILRNLALMNDHLGDYEQSRHYYRWALEVYARVLPPGHPETGSALFSLAVVEVKLGNFAAARSLYEESLAIREKSLGPDHPLVGENLINLATLLARTGRYAEARPLQERALGIMERGLGPDHSHVQEARQDLAWVLEKLGDLEGSYAVLQKVSATNERVLGPEHPEVGRSLNALGDIEVQLGRLPEAEKHYSRSLAILEKTYGPGHPDTCRSLVGLGDLRFSKGLLADAEDFYARALAIQRSKLGENHPAVADSLIRLAQVHWAGNRPGKAFQESMDAETILLTHFGLSLRGLSEREALEFERVRASGMDTALSILAGTPSSELPATALEQAWTALARSRALVLDQVASLHRAPAGEDEPEIDRISRDLRSATGRLSDLMVRGPDPDHPGQYAADLQEATKGKEALERRLAEKSPEFGLRLQNSKATLADLRGVLPSDSALVAYTLHRKIDPKAATATPQNGDPHPASAYLAFVVQSGASRPMLVPLGSQAEIDPLIDAWRKRSTSAPSTLPAAAERAELDLRNAGDRLRARLWDPVARRLGKSSRVLIVPDGAVNLLSFATLPTGKDRYLVEDAPTLHYLSAERDLLAQADWGRGTGSGALVVGGPDFDADPRVLATPSTAASTGRQTYRSAPPSCGPFRSVRFDPLPGATNEAAKIQKLLASAPAGRSSQIVELTAGKATEEAFKALAPGKKMLHIATHGFFLNSRCPALEASGRGGSSAGAVSLDTPLLLSGLVLAGANRRDEARPGEEDGVLTSEEIATLDLSSVDWAVLSACETGLGEIQAGEGVLGLRRAFQIAGARTLIMSLWKVGDDSTQEWMRNLYANRLAGMSTAEAARRASVSMIQAERARGKSTHPFFWGGFVAAGDWR
jgi:CHAT domain-containing protein